MGLENFVTSLNKKQEEQDAVNTIEKKQLTEKEINTPELTLTLDNLYSDMSQGNYADIENSFQKIKAELAQLENSNLKAKVDLIEEGIRDKEYGKFNLAMKAVREIKEMLKK